MSESRKRNDELMTKYAGSKTIEFSGAMLRDVFQRHSGNLREGFFELFPEKKEYTKHITNQLTSANVAASICAGFFLSTNLTPL